jgi:hypothetical protein
MGKFYSCLIRLSIDEDDLMELVQSCDADEAKILGSVTRDPDWSIDGEARKYLEDTVSDHFAGENYEIVEMFAMGFTGPLQLHGLFDKHRKEMGIMTNDEIDEKTRRENIDKATLALVRLCNPARMANMVDAAANTHNFGDTQDRRKLEDVIGKSLQRLQRKNVVRFEGGSTGWALTPEQRKLDTLASASPAEILAVVERLLREEVDVAEYTSVRLEYALEAVKKARALLEEERS